MLGCALAQAAPSVLNDGTHAADKIAPAITATLGSQPLFLDYSTSGDFVANSSNVSNGYFAVGTTTPTVNHAVYAVINSSSCCYQSSYDQQYYATLIGQGTLFSSPMAVQVGGTLPAGTAPPVAFVSSSSQNSFNGGTGWGIEFGLSTSYLGLDTSADSWVSAEMAGFLAALLNNHPTWTPGDVKAALRVTAANWATGYDHTHFGYGLINWSAANSPGTLYLQPPGVMVQNNGYFAGITLFPFRQTRRVREVIYSVSAAYVWPVKNEYTTSDLTASGGTLLYTSNGTDVMPAFSYAPAASGTVTLIALTTDGSGNYSRVEEFSKQSITLTVGTACPH